MATYEIIRGGTTYNISNWPIRLVDIDNLGGAGVRNEEERGPFQDGTTHLDERLEPGTFTLKLNVVGETAAARDTHRDTLNAMFKPVRGVPIIFRVTRDDGEVRQVDCRRTGPVAIPLKPEDGPGHLHRAVVQLRAADPTWYGPTEETLTYSGGAFQWYTGYNAIPAADVLEQAQSPTQGQRWANSGSVAAGSAWTIFFRGGSVTPTSTEVFAYYADVGPVGADATDTYFRADSNLSGGFQANAGLNGAMTGAWMVGTANYFLISYGGSAALYRDSSLIASDLSLSGGALPGSPAGTARWRSDGFNNASSRWPGTLNYAAVYRGALSATQMAALGTAVTAGSIFTAPVAYQGDWDSYPVITLTGPLANPIITNVTTGDVLNFSGSGGSIPAGSVWVINTLYGRKSVLQGTVSVINYLSDDSDLATFRFAPDPVAPGGTNVITISGSAVGTATSAQIAWRNRFVGH